jgi:hypothetical protein
MSLKFKTAQSARARILELNMALGIPNDAPIYNVARANLRIDALEGLLAAKQAAAPAALPAAVNAASKFLGLSAADRAQFSSDGGSITVDEFNALSPAAREKHYTLGGTVVAGDTKLVRRFDPDFPAKSNGLMSVKTFNSLGKNDQAAFLRHGGKLAA